MLQNTGSMFKLLLLVVFERRFMGVKLFHLVVLIFVDVLCATSTHITEAGRDTSYSIINCKGFSMTRE